jgi:transposase-like protein
MATSKVQNRSTKDDEVIRDIPMACADEKAAVEFMEKQRWGADCCCPRCGSVNVYQMKDSKTGERQTNYRWLCRDCRSVKAVCQYTVRTGTVFEDSRIELRHWCFSFWRASTSKKGVSALEIHRQTGLSYKSCLFLLNRIRFAMADSAPALLGPGGGDVEVDETYVGGKPRYKGQSKPGRGTRKACVVALVERGGSVKTKPVTDITGKNLKQFIRDNVDKSARILSDENTSYRGIGKEFDRGHEAVNHGFKEYVRLGTDIHSNTVEGFFSLVKRGITGIYHNVSKEHLHRYLAEYEFRYNHRELEDGARTLAAIKSSEGKRLLYKQPVQE